MNLFHSVLALAAHLICFPPTAGAAQDRLPHREEIAPGIHAAGLADRHGSANCGWAVLPEGTLLVDVPAGLDADAYLQVVSGGVSLKLAGLALTRFRNDELPLIEALAAKGAAPLYTSARIRQRLLAVSGVLRPEHFATDPPDVEPEDMAGDTAPSFGLLPLDGVTDDGAAAIYLPRHRVLFGGALVIHGPRVVLPGSHTRRWMAALDRLAALAPKQVIPGYGSWAGPEVLHRQRELLWELRQQVGYVIAQGRGADVLTSQVHVSPSLLVWMPYDNPTAEDLLHVYQELTVPYAPFEGQPPARDDAQTHALVLIGDQPHEPGHLEAGLRPVFEATGVTAHVTVDVRALTAQNLAHVQLLVMLRDGIQRPVANDHSQDYVWMTPEQQQAVVEFVEGGGAFLNLHNSMGLYPEGGPYLHLVGGRYVGHGPLERFRVEVLDPHHPITRGISPFFVADEQHTPEYDADRVHLLLRNRADDGTTGAAGWVREPGRGRLCHLANGHTREALLHPTYQRLLRQAVLWCLRREAEIEHDKR